MSVIGLASVTTPTSAPSGTSAQEAVPAGAAFSGRAFTHQNSSVLAPRITLVLSAASSAVMGGATSDGGADDPFSTVRSCAVAAAAAMASTAVTIARLETKRERAGDMCGLRTGSGPGEPGPSFHCGMGRDLGAGNRGRDKFQFRPQVDITSIAGTETYPDPDFQTPKYETSERERADEAGTPVGIAPARTERAARERVDRRESHGRFVDSGQRMEPLHRATAWIVMQVTRDGELRLGGRDPNLVAVRLEPHWCRGDVDDLVDEPARNPADERDEGVPLCGSGAAVHDEGGTHRGRCHTANLADAQIPIAGDSGDDAHAIERHAVRRRRG